MMLQSVLAEGVFVLYQSGKIILLVVIKQNTAVLQVFNLRGGGTLAGKYEWQQKAHKHSHKHYH